MQFQQTILCNLLSTHVLTSIANLNKQTVLQGLPVPGRMSQRKRFPRVDFYGDQEMVCGLLGHKHVYSELAIVTQGQLNVGIGDQIYHAKQGDCLLFLPQTVHGECCLPSGSPYELLWIIFPKSNCRNIHLTRYNKKNGYHVLAGHQLNNLPLNSAQYDPFFSQTLWNNFDVIRYHLIQEVSQLLTKLKQLNHQPPHEIHPLIVQVLDIIKTSSIHAPTVVDLANQVGLSPNYLSNLFHQETGSRLAHHISQTRIECAKEMLTNPARSVKEIAYALGFSDPYHFSRVFRRVAAMSPSAFRKSL